MGGSEKMLLTKIEGKVEREFILSRRKESRKKCGLNVDEDLSMKERKLRWMMIEIVRREREKGKGVEVKNRELWVENRIWSWDKERNRWGEEVEDEEELED